MNMYLWYLKEVRLRLFFNKIKCFTRGHVYYNYVSIAGGYTTSRTCSRCRKRQVRDGWVDA